MKRLELRGGASTDAILLMVIKLATTMLGFVITRLLSEYLSVYDYGTYSQILLVVSTVSSLTILGMMDGVNYFYSNEQNESKRESYIATLFAFQCIVSAVAGCAVLVLSGPLCRYFDNPDVQRLLIFAVLLPFFQNVLNMFQVLLVSVGKARMLALRNLIVSLIRLAAVVLVVAYIRDVAVILLTTVLLDVGQIGFFFCILRKSGCHIRLKRADMGLVKHILCYCLPMAVFTAINTLNRDMDKYLIAICTDTQILAIYTNASKALPFDIVMTSFCTVLLPEITRRVGRQENEAAAGLYKQLLEIACISTAILCFAALAASPQLMELLYSHKYISGLTVFCIYILVDLFRFTNMTLVLSAAGKTRTIMFLGIGSICANAVLNVTLFYVFGLPGPALATLLCVIGTGVLMLHYSAKVLDTTIAGLLDLKYLAGFLAENILAVLGFCRLQMWLAEQGIHYILILVLVCGCYGCLMVLLHGKRLFSALKQVNRATKKI